MDPAALLRAHGIEVTRDDLDAAARAAGDRGAACLRADLPTEEAALLRAGAFALAGASDAPLVCGLAEDAAIRRTALAPAEVARRIRVSEARVVERLEERSLFGLRTPEGWRVPRFQLTDHGELPGWDRVARALPADLSPVELLGWLHAPNADLPTGADEAPTSPRDWLLAGRDPAALAALAGDLG